METMLRASYKEIEDLKSLSHSLNTENKRLVGELRRFSKKPISNFVETDLVKKKALADVSASGNE